MYGSILTLSLLAAPSASERAEAIEKMNAGVDLVAAGDLAGAEKAFKEASHVDPKYDGLWLNFGILYQRQGKLVDAEKAFETGIESSLESGPGSGSLFAELHYRLGAALETQSKAPGVSQTDAQAKLKKALTHFEAAAKAEPDRARAHLHVGRTYQALDEPKQADLAYRRAIEADPLLSQAYVELGNMYIDYGFPNVALKVLEVNTKVNDKDASAWEGLGRAQLVLEHAEDAITAFEKALALDPDRVMVLYGLGMAHADRLQRKEAIARLQEFLRKAGTDVPESYKKNANNTIARMQDVI